MAGSSYTPYTSNYDTYGMGPQYRFFAPQNGDRQVFPALPDPTSPPVPGVGDAPMPEIPPLDVNGGGGADTGGGDSGMGNQQAEAKSLGDFATAALNGFGAVFASPVAAAALAANIATNSNKSPLDWGLEVLGRDRSAPMSDDQAKAAIEKALDTSDINAPAPVSAADFGLDGGGFNGPGAGFDGGSEAGSNAESNAGDRYARGGLARYAEGGVVTNRLALPKSLTPENIQALVEKILATGGAAGRAGLRDYGDAVTGYRREYDPTYGSDVVSQEPVDRVERAKTLTQTLLPTVVPRAARYAEGGFIEEPLPQEDPGYVDMDQRYAKGGLAQAAQQVAGAGRHGDTQIVHLGPVELQMLEEIFGPATRNPETGAPEHFSFGSFLKSVVPTVAGIVTRSLTGGNDLAGAAVTGLTSKLLGGKTSDALMNAALQYGGGKIVQGLSGSGSFMDNITGPVTDFENLGKGPLQDQMFGGGYEPESIPLPQQKPTPVLAGGEMAPEGGSMTDYTPAPRYQPPGGTTGLLDIAKSSLTSTPALVVAGLGVLNEMNRPKTTNPGNPAAAAAAANSTTPYSSEPLKRGQNQYQGDYYTYGIRPQFSFFTPVNAPPVRRARGGLAEGGGHLSGPNGGQDDDIPARLSAGEFVIPADVVASLGDGNNEAGAAKLESFMDAVRDQKAVKGHPPKAKSISAYLQERRS